MALEPNPLSYKLALENVKINQGVSNVVTILNAGYGKDGTVRVDQKFISTSMDLKSSDVGESIQIFSLKTLFREAKVEGRVVLKMDCEGCEYNLLDEDDEMLRRFDQIAIEYHYGLERLVKS
ncbi:FkbM family methyltransferase [Acidianus sp. RZ1]|uniref:FkbM family methyltransferase n=1 Tax=Acidianus sp. RZ1 TaxID=1540082 RepID=UPI00352FFF7F